MKKLNLNVADFGATEILTREELMNVLGGTTTGTGSGSYWFSCYCSEPLSVVLLPFTRWVQAPDMITASLELSNGECQLYNSVSCQKLSPDELP